MAVTAAGNRILTYNEAQELSPEELIALRSEGIYPGIEGGAVSAAVYGLWLQKLGMGTTGGAWSSAAAGWASTSGDTVKCALVTTTGIGAEVTARNTRSLYSAISGELTTAGGYTATGATVTPRTISAIQGTPAANTIAFLGTIPPWTSSSFTAGGAVIYNTSSPTAGAVIAYINFGGDQTVASGTFTITADVTNGIWCLSAS